MSAVPPANANRTREVSRDAPPDKDLRGLMPYLRRYPLGIIFGLLMVVLMSIVVIDLPLDTGIMTDTLAGNAVPFEHSTQTGSPLVVALNSSKLSNSIPYYAPSSRRTLGIYCLIVVLCVGIKGVLSFSARWTLIVVSRDIEFDIRNDHGTCPGKSRRRARRARLRSGRIGNARLRHAQPRVCFAKHPPHPNLEHVHAVTSGAHWHNLSDCAVAGWSSGLQPPDFARRFHCFLWIPYRARLAHDRPRMGDKYFSAQRRLHGPAQLHPHRRTEYR